MNFFALKGSNCWRQVIAAEHPARVVTDAVEEYRLLPDTKLNRPHMMTYSEAPTLPQILLTSAGRGWEGIAASFLHFPRGLAEVAPAIILAPLRQGMNQV
jgi:hypothetical protein